MNIVKGVADLLRRSSGGQGGDCVSWANADKHSSPSPKIQFSETGDEAVLATLWQRYENTIDKVEKRKSLQVFFLHFIQTYRDWEPENDDQLSIEVASLDDTVVGCSSGHPSEVMLIIVQELARLTSLVSELNSSTAKYGADVAELSTSLTYNTDGLYALNSLMIANRSWHNCKVFSYYGGVQKVAALLKAAVVQLKALASAPSVDESSSCNAEKIRFLQTILGYVVSIVSGFMGLYSSGNKTVEHMDFIKKTFVRYTQPEISSMSLKDSISQPRKLWQQRAIVMVMEAGGLNWLVELLRVIRRLNLKEQWTDLSLHYSTLGALKLALYENPRAQNHFRSIGGLEVLLDEIGPPSSNFSATRSTIISDDDRRICVYGIFHLQVLSLETLRESVFGNTNNLQFLCENGRIHKFANGICWPAFILQDWRVKFGLAAVDSQDFKPNSEKENPEMIPQDVITLLNMSDSSNLLEWKKYSVRLSRGLCSFLLAPEDMKGLHGEASSKNSMPISLGFWELCIRWIMKILLTIFQCMKACSNERELPSHIRVLDNTMQRCILSTFRRVLLVAPALLEVFREEGVWSMIFSEKFFCFEPFLEELDGEFEVKSKVKGFDIFAISDSFEDKPKNSHVDILQVEAISFLEFAAALTANTNNLPECSVLIDALEQSAHNPELATIFLRSLQRILQLMPDRCLGSFKSLDVITRALKVACIQARELRKHINNGPDKGGSAEIFGERKIQAVNCAENATSWVKCMQSSMKLFNEYVSIAEHVRSSVLHNASCIDCLFDLFWEKSVRKDVLEHILGLIKLPTLLPDDRTAKLQLCSKYLETFTHAKEWEEFYPELSIDLLVSMREIISIDHEYYQTLFREGECFLHIVSLLNGTYEEEMAEQLVLNVLHTLTLLLTGSNDSKAAFRALVGVGYQTLQSLLLDFCKWHPREGLLNALLDMLVDGKFDKKENSVIKNDDVIPLFFNVVQKCSTSLQHYGLDVFQNLLKDSITNRTSCSKAGLLTVLLDWFAIDEDEKLITKLAQLIQVIGGHSISGKDIRKIFTILRSESIGSKNNNSSLLLKSLQYMLKEKGPEAFFEFSGYQSGILIKTPLQWPYYKGFSFTCWLRVEDFPEDGVMGLFSFLSENGRGCSAMLGKEKLIFESINQKRQSISLSSNFHPKNWLFLCITYSVGRAFSGGSSVKCYVDGEMVSSDKCRYAKVSDALTRCTIGTEYIPTIEGSGPINYEKVFPFVGQMGPIYMFGEALITEQIKIIYSLGPSYMYSFIGDEILVAPDASPYDAILDAKDGLSSKIIFGLNAQASNGSNLFNVSSMIDNSPDKGLIVAAVMEGTQLCSRRLLQEIIYCVGGVTVFFPLLTQFNGSESDDAQREYMLIKTITKDKLAVDVIGLISSVLDGNLSNQQQMHLLGGLSILGFLFQSVPPQQLNLEALTALKHLFGVLQASGISQVLLKEAISQIYLNPHIWVYASYEVQRDLYMFLIQYFEKEKTLLPQLCSLPCIIDVICHFYWDKADGGSVIGSQLLYHSITKQVIGQRPGRDEVRKIRLLLLSLAEMSLSQRISTSDIKALIAFFERSQDMVCIEDVLHMVIRSLSHKQLLASFLEQVNLLGGCHLFINLLQRELEPIRLLGLQFLGKLLVGVPSEKKGNKFFSLSVGRSKSISDNLRKGGNTNLQPVFSAISEKLFAFPLSDHLYATLFDVLLGGASPKQVLQRCNPSESSKNKNSNSNSLSSPFLVPQIFVCIFRFLASCNDKASRTKILEDLLDLLGSELSNTEAFMEHAWSSWLTTSVKLVALNSCEWELKGQDDTSRIHEIALIRNLYCVVLSHYVYSVKGGWYMLEETVNFLLLNYEQGQMLHSNLLREIFEDLVGSLFKVSSEENIFFTQPCRDNTLYLLKLADELFISEYGDKFPFLEFGMSSSMPSDLPLLENQDISSAVLEVLHLEYKDMLSRTCWSHNSTVEEADVEDVQWVLYDKLWILITEMIGKGQSKTLPKSKTLNGPSFGQRARGLVESLNIPAAEMAAVVVSGGIGTALGAKPTKYVDKAMLLRGEKCPRIVFHLLLLYLCKAGLDRALHCVHQFISLLPFLFSSDDDQSKNRLHFLIWLLLAVRTQHGMLDDGARFHVISHLILEIVNHGKLMIATSILGREDSFEVTNNSKETGFILSLIQKDRVLAAAAEEAKYTKDTKDERKKQLQVLKAKLEEFSLAEHVQLKAFEEDIMSAINKIISSNDSRKVAFQLAYDEHRQIVTDSWIRMFRTLIDERGPWSANPFPNNNVTHWKLDKTEDNWRRRPKLKRNYKFCKNLCYPQTNKISEEPNPYEDCTNIDGRKFPDQMKRFLLKGVRGITGDRPMDLPDDAMDSTAVNDSDISSFSETQASYDRNDNDGNIDIVHDGKYLSTISSELESDEVHFSSSCVLISPKRKLAGRFFVMQNVLHFTSQFLVEGTGGSSVFNKISDGSTSDASKSDHLYMNDKNNQNNGILGLELNRGKSNDFNVLAGDNLLKSKPNKIKKHRRWSILKIKAVHWTRYLLQYTALEIFFSDSVAPIFLNFAKPKDAKHVGSLIVSLRNESIFPKANSRDRSGMISFVDRRVALEMAETYRECWRRREISNFEYLMHLNTLAGRSYNDLTQYPVFPWVLADYSSEKLDFNKSSTFRDLSKPVGALDSKRFEVFEDRFLNFSDPDIPSFYYGSHYSSMGIVLFYLLRMEPFTSLHRSLQGGKFDHADRLFQCIEGTFRNCLSNTSDVKELIPEFFYMPEFLTNSNSYYFGVKQDGEAIGDVILPPWAKDSPEEFICQNREALESEYVSSNLHHWIDLIFGYKQRGKPAIEAANVFYYLTYEGAVDLESTENALQRSAIEDQIANFGQTPIQLFRKKHPRRGPPVPVAHPLYFAPSSISLTSIVSNVTNPPSAVIFIGLLDSNIVVVNHELILSVKLWLSTQLYSGVSYTFSGSQEPFFGIGADVFPHRKIATSLANDLAYGKHCLSKLQKLNENYLILCGSWENSFQVISVHDGKIVQSIRQHKDLVSCIAVVADGGILATGSFDTTVMVWHTYRGKFTEKKAKTMQSDYNRKDHVIIETPFHILCGHDDVITCLFISRELDIVISGSKDATCVFHTLREGRYVRSIQHPSGCPVSKLVASQHGRMVIYADNDLSLHMYSINGKCIASSESNGRLNCIELSASGDFLVCAGDHGQIVLRSMYSLDVLQRFEGIGKVITSVKVTPEECILAGTKDGSLLLYSLDNLQLRKGSLPRNAKSKPTAAA